MTIEWMMVIGVSALKGFTAGLPVLALILAPVCLGGQQAASPRIDDCSQLYNENKYGAARDCFSRVLATDPDNARAREYLRLSSLRSLNTVTSEDSSHAPGTPEIAALRELIQQALNSNPAVRRAEQQVEAARAGTWRDPPILAAEFSRWGVRLLSPRQSLARLGVTLSEELQTEIAEVEVQFWQALLAVQSNQLVADVRKSFFELLAIRRQFQVHEEHRRALTAHKRLALSRYSQGEASQSEILEAQQQEGQGIEQLIRLEQKELMARATLNSLLDRDSASPIQLPESVATPPFLWDLRQLEHMALTLRPEVRVAKARLEYVALLGQTEMSGEFQNTLLSAEKLGLEIIENETRKEVHQAFAIADKTFRLLQFYETSLEPQLETALLSAKAYYRGGQGDYAQLLASQHQLIASRIQIIQTQSDYLVSLAALQRVSGAPLPPSKSETKTSFRPAPNNP